MKRLLLIPILVFFMACTDKDDDDDKKCNDPLGCDGQLPIGVISGKAEKGPFLKDSDVTATAYDTNWNQSDFPKEGSTEEDDGSYQIFSPVTGPYVRTRIDGLSYNEVKDIYEWIFLRDMDTNDGGKKNLNPMTHTKDIVAFDHCRDSTHQYYRQGDYCLPLAESEILSYLEFNDHGVEFNQMSLQGDTISDAQMAVFSWYIASQDSGNDHMRGVANGVLSNNLFLKQSIQDEMWSMPFKKISDNLMNKYAGMDVSADRVPFWLLPQVPDYYELMHRTPDLLHEKNTAYNNKGIIDVSDMKIFAYPKVFQNAETANYLALDIPNAKGIYTVKSCGTYLCPDSKIADLEQMNEVLIETPVKLDYNYKITGDISSDVQYFVWQEFDEFSTPDKLIEGYLVPFGNNLASQDGSSWIGGGNVTGWYKKEIKSTLSR